MEKRVGIVVLNFNGMDTKFGGKPILTQTLEWLKKTKYANYKTVLFDDASQDDSVKYAKRYKIDTIASKKNLFNFAKANNIGMRYALKNYKPDYIVLISNDVFVTDRNWLSKLVDTAEADENIGLVTCKQVYPTGRIQYAGALYGIAPRARGRGDLDRKQYDKIEEVEGANAVICLIKKKVLDKIGLFDENFDFGSEDDDLSMRIKKAGFKIMYNGEVKVTHLEGYTSTAAGTTKKRDVTFYKNQVSFAYLVLKDYSTLKKIPAFLILFCNSIFSIEGKDRKRGLTSLRFKSRPPWRLYVTSKALFHAYRLWLENKNKKTS